MALKEENFNGVAEKAVDNLDSSKLDLANEVSEEVEKEDKIVDINIGGVKKSKFRINGDDSSILELNLSDMNFANRLEKGYKNITNILVDVSKIAEDDSNLSDKLKRADHRMREQLDYIFDSNVSEICGKGGTMYDVTNGTYRFEHIIDSLTKLYSANANAEYKKLKARIQKHTEQYTKSNKSRKGK